MTLDEVRNEIKKRDDSFIPSEIDLRQTKMEGGILLADGNELFLEPQSKKQLLNCIGVPEPFFNKAPIDLKDTIVNRLMKDQGVKTMLISTAQAGPNRIVSFLQAPYIPALTVFDHFVEGTVEMGGRFEQYSDVEVNSYIASPGEITLQLLGGKLDIQPRKGDFTKGGVSFFHSDIGDLPTTINTFMYRLICLNGMQVIEPSQNSGTGTLYRPRKEEAFNDFFQNIQGATRYHWMAVSERLAHFAELYQKQIQNPVDYLTSLLKKHRMPAESIEAAIRALNNEPETMDTMAGIVNAMTNVASHGQELALSTRTYMNKLASDRFTEDHTNCPYCRNSLN